MRPRILVVQERLTHYRVPFFEQLRSSLAAEGIDLDLAHGRGHGSMATRGDEAELSWAKVLDNRVVGVRGHSVVWQPVIRLSSEVDLVIVEQASRMAVNYALLARQAARGPRVAFWGHGANLQADGSWISRVSETAKARYSRLPHWWFAYTEGSAGRVEALGFPSSRITVVQNAIDTSLITATTAVRDPHRCIFVGGLYQGKRLDLLFAVADLVAADLPSFRLVIAGDGELRNYVESEASRRPYVDYVGAKFGTALAVELKKSSLMIMPGAVGLGVLDAFAAQLPVVSAKGLRHGPEFEYLQDGVNALLSAPSAIGLSAAVLHGLREAGRMRAAGCLQASEQFTLAAMVDRFGQGLIDALASKEAA